MDEIGMDHLANPIKYYGNGLNKEILLLVIYHMFHTERVCTVNN